MRKGVIKSNSYFEESNYYNSSKIALAYKDTNGKLVETEDVALITVDDNFGFFARQTE